MSNIVNTYLRLFLIIFMLSSPLYAIEPSAINEAEVLETGGEPLSAELEYIDIFEEGLDEYIQGNSQQYNLGLCEFLLEKIMQLSKFTGENRDPLEMIERAKEQPDIPATLQSRLVLAEIEIYLRQGNTKKARELAESIGFIKELLIERPDIDKLTTFSTIAPDFCLPIGLVSGVLDEKETRAHVIIKSIEESDIALHFGNSTPITISLNGVDQLRTTTKRRAIADQQAIGLHLDKGLNILTLVCQNKPTTKLYLRLTNPDGSNLNPDSVIISNQEITTIKDLDKLIATTRTDMDELPPSIKTGAEQFFASLYNSDNANHRVAYYLGYLMMMRESLADTPQAVKQLLLNAARYSPETGIYLMAIAEANDESKRFVADREENMRRMSLEKAIKLDPNNIQARAEIARYYLSSQNSPDRAEKYIDEAIKINPIAVISNTVLYDIYKTRGWDARALQVAQETAKRDPQHPLVQRILARALIDNSTIDDSLTAFEESYKQDATDNSAAINIFRLLIRTGATDKAIAFALKHLELDPYNTQLRQEYIELLLENKNKTTLTAIQTAKDLFPNSNTFTKLLGDYYATIAHDNETALKYYQEALSYDPADLKTSKYLDFKGITKESALKEIQNITEYVAKVSAGRIPSGTDKAYILSEKYDKLNLGGTRSRTTHLIVQVLTKNGATSLKRYPIWNDKETEETSVNIAKVTHPDGSSSLAQTSTIQRQGDKDITLLDFPALEAGDILEIEYTISQTKPNFFGSYFGNIQLFSNTLPILESRYILSAPKNEKLYFNSTDTVPDPEVIEGENETTYIWTMTDLPAITFNPFSPPINELSPAVEVSTFKDWNALAKWYWNLIKDQNQITPDIAAKVKDLTFGSKTDKEKLAAIFNWVTSEVRNNAWEFGVHGFKPYNAGTIFTRRFGDCKDKAILINVMAKVAGIDAWPMLLRSTQNDNVVVGRGREDLTLPLLSHFNHCISYAELDGEPYYLDGTMMFRTIDSRPSTDASAPSVIIRPSGAEITSTPPYSGDANRWVDYTGIGLNAEGTADIDFTIATTGESSMYLRAWFSNQSTWDNVLKAISTERYGHVSAVFVEDFGSNEGLDKDEEMLKGRVRIRDYAKQRSDKKLSFSIPKPILSRIGNSAGAFPSELSSYAITSKRSTDLILPTLYKVERHIKIEWPSGWELSEKLPEDVNIDTEFGRLSIAFEKINNILKLDYIMELKKVRITSKEYPSFRSFCFKADKPTRTSFTLYPEE